CHRACDCQATRCEESFPPARAPLRQTWRNLPPYACAVVLARIGHRNRIERREHFFQSSQLRPALAALFEVRRHRLAALWLAFPESKHLFFLRMSHSRVTPAGAARRVSKKGASACRNFCTARNTVFLAALLFDFSTAAISSMPQPSQWRMTMAVRSA